MVIFDSSVLSFWFIKRLFEFRTKTAVFVDLKSRSSYKNRPFLSHAFYFVDSNRNVKSQKSCIFPITDEREKRTHSTKNSWWVIRIFHVLYKTRVFWFELRLKMCNGLNDWRMQRPSNIMINRWNAKMFAFFKMKRSCISLIIIINLLGIPMDDPFVSVFV